MPEEGIRIVLTFQVIGSESSEITKVGLSPLPSGRDRRGFLALLLNDLSMINQIMTTSFDLKRRHA